jgi:hypothetical protein
LYGHVRRLGICLGSPSLAMFLPRRKRDKL